MKSTNPEPQEACAPQINYKDNFGIIDLTWIDSCNQSTNEGILTGVELSA